MQKSKIAIVIAAYNEERRIAKVIGDLRSEGYENLFIVDDGSQDKTVGIAARAGVPVIRHRRNRGQGAALRTGIKAALAEGAEAIVTFDGDGQHQAKEIKKLTDPIAKGQADIVLGSRFLGKARGIPWYKLITLKGSILVERMLLGVKLTDVHNGFRAMSAHAARRIRITCERMSHASEIIAEIRYHRLTYREVPVTIRYDDYTNTKGQSIFNSFVILKEIIQMKLRMRTA